MTTDASAMPEELMTQIAEVLRHFYDYPYLRRHPLLGRLPHLVGENSVTAVQRLRTLLLQAVEALKPPADLPPDSQAQRPYQVVYKRYVLGNTLEDVEAELGLSGRQIQREQQRAFSEIASRLWAAETAETSNQPSRREDPLAREVERASGKAQVFDTSAELQTAVGAVRPLAASHGLRVRLGTDETPLRALGDPPVFRQLLISALSYLIRLKATASVCATAIQQGTRVVCRLEAQGVALAVPADDISSSVVSTLRTLAQTTSAEIEGPRVAVTDPTHILEDTSTSVEIEITLPAIGTERVVAVLEDNKDLVALYARYLARHGCRVVDMDEPSSALESMAASPPDAIVLDVMLSAVDGWQILQSVRAHPRLHRVPVIVCSVLNEPELAASLGANAYLKKPVRATQLLECVARLVTRKHSAEASL